MFQIARHLRSPLVAVVGRFKNLNLRYFNRNSEKNNELQGNSLIEYWLSFIERVRRLQPTELLSMLLRKPPQNDLKIVYFNFRTLFSVDFLPGTSLFYQLSIEYLKSSKSPSYSLFARSISQCFETSVLKFNFSAEKMSKFFRGGNSSSNTSESESSDDEQQQVQQPKTVRKLPA